jgi:hypothetical protein
MVAACHTYIPVESSTPPVGETFAFLISDRGRIGLADRLGPGVARIEGRMTGTEGNEYLISVRSVALLNGTTDSWSGETMRLDRDFVDRLQRKELSKTRSWLLAGAVAGGVAVLIASKGLTEVFGQDEREPPKEPPPEQRIGRRSRP